MLLQFKMYNCFQDQHLNDLIDKIKIFNQYKSKENTFTVLKYTKKKNYKIN